MLTLDTLNVMLAVSEEGLIEEVVMLWSNLNGHFDRVFSPRQGT